jgi:glycine dehydrogenase
MASFFRAARLIQGAGARAHAVLLRGAQSAPTTAKAAARVRAFASDPWARTDAFLTRHIGPGEKDTAHMLKTIGCSSLEDLMSKAVPKHIRLATDNVLPEPVGEQEALAELRGFAKENKVFRSFIGMGYHGTYTPSVVLRNVVENPGWYTSYTPYQPEIAQGRLEMLLNYQTMITSLTGLEFSNASLLDESTAAAEAFTMCLSNAKGKRAKFFVDASAHPQTIDLIRTRAGPLHAEVVLGDAASLSSVDLSGFCGALVQYPNTYGSLFDASSVVPALKAAGVPLVVATDPLALALLKTPGDIGADIAVGSAQRFGVAMFYGGPHAGFLAVSKQCVSARVRA